jgi:hypothetical protein
MTGAPTRLSPAVRKQFGSVGLAEVAREREGPKKAKGKVTSRGHYTRAQEAPLASFTPFAVGLCRPLSAHAFLEELQQCLGPRGIRKELAIVEVGIQKGTEAGQLSHAPIVQIAESH